MFNACFYNILKALESKFTSKTQWFTTESNKKMNLFMKTCTDDEDIQD